MNFELKNFIKAYTNTIKVIKKASVKEGKDIVEPTFGASFTAVTVIAMVSVALEKALVPPEVAVVTLVPAVPEV